MHFFTGNILIRQMQKPEPYMRAGCCCVGYGIAIYLVGWIGWLSGEMVGAVNLAKISNA